MVSKYLSMGTQFLSDSGVFMVSVSGIPRRRYRRWLRFRPFFDKDGDQLFGFCTIPSRAHHATAKFEPWPAVLILRDRQPCQRPWKHAVRYGLVNLWLNRPFVGRIGDIKL